MTQVRKFRKKPVVIEAMRYDGSDKGLYELLAWGQRSDPEPVIHGIGYTVYIRTLEGDMEVSAGDYVIRGVQGEFYPCKPDIFEATYDEVVELDASGIMTPRDIRERRKRANGN